MKKHNKYNDKWMSNSPKDLRLFYLLALIGLILFMFLGLPDEILYAKSFILRLTPFAIIFFLIPFLLFKALINLNINAVWSLNTSIASVFIVAPIFGFWIGHLSDIDLKKHEKITIGIVSEKWKSKNTWLYIATFEVNGKQYKTFTETDYENIYHVGSTVNIRFSNRNPENNTVKQ